MLEVRDRMKRLGAMSDGHGGLVLGRDVSAGETLQAIYEEEEKARILRKALDERVDAAVRLMREKVFQ